MKGGYQILDLTGATAGSPVEVKGIYKAAAGNNGKPVMILTNDGQRVYSEIAEDDGDYITCYISAEGKTVKVTIESDDSVTTVIADDAASIEALTQGLNEVSNTVSGLTNEEGTGTVDEIDDRISKNRIISSATGWVDITAYDGSEEDKFFTCPSDGYVAMSLGVAASNIGQVILANSKSKSDAVTMLRGAGNSAQIDTRSLFVRQGQIIYTVFTGTVDIHFAPLQ